MAPSINDNYKIPLRFRGHIMHQQLDFQIGFNFHEKISGSHQHGGTASLTTSNFIEIRTKSSSSSEGLGRCTWQLFCSQVSSNLRKVICYRPVPPAPSSVSASVYTQNLTHFSQVRRIFFSGEISWQTSMTKISIGKGEENR